MGSAKRAEVPQQEAEGSDVSEVQRPKVMKDEKTVLLW